MFNDIEFSIKMAAYPLIWHQLNLFNPTDNNI